MEYVHLSKAELEAKVETLRQEMELLKCICAQVGMLLSLLFLMAALPLIVYMNLGEINPSGSF